MQGNDSGSDESLSAVQPNAKYTSTSRRKATQKPVGPDQKRQAFSKRKRGIVLKAYQLYKLTDAKVFMFVVNDKGASWSYASPGFHSTQLPEHLMYMREKAGLPHLHPSSTEVMPHPGEDEADRQVDQREEQQQSSSSSSSKAHSRLARRCSSTCCTTCCALHRARQGS
ncbi:hypothetical protein V8C86DRAFT_444622 [Haematococcus lacustris]